MAELLQRLAGLESQVQSLTARIAELEQNQALPEIPEWAREAVRKAVEQGLVNTPENGSLDFYRFLTVLERKGLLG